MGILLCEQNFCDVWIRNESVRAEIGQILHTDTHTTAAKLVVRMEEQPVQWVIVVAVVIIIDNGDYKRVWQLIVETQIGDSNLDDLAVWY